MPSIASVDTSHSFDGHVRDCGLNAVSDVTGIDRDKVAAEFTERFGSICVTGKQMRQYLTDMAWEWVRTSQFDTVPDHAVVVTRRGFFPVVCGVAYRKINARICGYYHP